ncbi:MarR family winged helix-turn-helix transcriptional regulator [Oceanobacillus indicireducens]|uniref:HTH-type transcriptional regulator MhqR n=1 Tax=Oceanobacillus indicireducens TaxID=1004261 RepID=A0A917XXD3_9BACI|nr:MarR family transcriptional regulator [Oceanobacillus indicireducens]GGN55854.1 HTH-type transcriptional regulator MhqR [Oceanobacillus indicireducens]
MSENLSLKSFVVLMKASKTLEEMVKKDIAAHGMKLSDFSILEALYHKGRQTIKQISEAVLINTGSITYVIDKLEKNELLRRTNCKDDRRVIYIEITDKGKEVMNEVFPKHQARIEEVFEGISEEHKEILIETIKTVGKRAGDLV